MKYKAFISYKHEEKDTEVAKYLRKNIENYKIPKSVRKQLNIHSVGRVFRDTEELATSNSLSDEIEAALKESEYLLVICSPNTQNSRWVLQEIENFIKFHDREHIIPILVDGEPEDSFPEILCHYFDEKTGNEIFVEPLAADFRNMSKKNTSNELLRVVAQLLGCSYDTLKDRAKLRKTRRLVGFSMSALVIVAIVAITSILGVIRTKHAYQKQLISQSRYLADTAIKLSNEGYTDTAILLALEALPDSTSKNKRPYVAAAEYALSEALNTYGSISDYSCIEQINCGETIQYVTTSYDEQYLLAESTNSTIYVYDTTEYKLINKFQNDKLTFSQVGFTPENDIYILSSSDLYIINLSTFQEKNIYHCDEIFSDKSSETIQQIQVSPNGELVAFASMNLDNMNSSLYIWNYSENIFSHIEASDIDFQFLNNNLILLFADYYSDDANIIYHIEDLYDQITISKYISISENMASRNIVTNFDEFLDGSFITYDNNTVHYFEIKGSTYNYLEFKESFAPVVIIDSTPNNLELLLENGQYVSYSCKENTTSLIQDFSYFTKAATYYNDTFAIVPEYKSNFICIVGKKTSTYTPIDNPAIYINSCNGVYETTDGKFLALRDFNSTIIFDVKNNKMLKQIDESIPIQFIADSHKLVYQLGEYSDITLIVYDLDTDETLYKEDLANLVSAYIVLSIDQDLVAIIDSNFSSTKLYLFDLSRDYSLMTYDLPEDIYYTLLLNSKELLYFENDCYNLYNFVTGEKYENLMPNAARNVSTFKYNYSYIDNYKNVAATKDTIAYITKDFELNIYDIKTSKLITVSSEKYYDCELMKFLPDNRLLTYVKEGIIEIINTKTGEAENVISIDPMIMNEIQVISNELIAIYNYGENNEYDRGYVININPKQNCIVAKIPHYRYYSSLADNYYVFFDTIGYYHKHSLYDLLSKAAEKVKGRKLTALEKQKYYIE